MSPKIRLKLQLELLQSYYEKNKDASAVYIEGKTAFRAGKLVDDNPYQGVDQTPFYIHWEQGFTDEHELLKDLVKIAVDYYSKEDGE
jgi:hypothetical protein